MNIRRFSLLVVIVVCGALTGMSFAYQISSSNPNLPSQNANPDNEEYQQLRDVPAFKKALQTKNDTTNTIISNFEQEKKLEVMEQNIVTKGKFYFQKPGKLRWEYTDPFDYLIIVNNDQVMIEDKGNTSKFDMGNNELFQQVNDLLVNLVRGNIFSSDDYNANFFKNKSTYKVELIPNNQDMKEYIEAIHIIFAKKSLEVQQVKMLENAGDYTRIDFTDKRLNEDIPAKFFEMR